MAAASDTDSVVPETTPKPQIVYRCKKCRRIVATEEYVVAHKRGKGETCFKWKKRSGGMEEPPECTSIFVEPMMWMEAGGFLIITLVSFRQIFIYTSLLI